MRCWAWATARAPAATTMTTASVPARRQPTGGFLRYPLTDIHVRIVAAPVTIAAGAPNAGHIFRSSRPGVWARRSGLNGGTRVGAFCANSELTAPRIKRRQHALIRRILEAGRVKRGCVIRPRLVEDVGREQIGGGLRRHDAVTGKRSQNENAIDRGWTDERAIVGG